MELEGLRRQISFAEAAKLADVEGPPLTFDRAAMRLTQSPLFQRMGEKIEEDATEQNIKRIVEVERQHDLDQMSMQTGLNRQDLEEIVRQLSGVRGPEGPMGPQGPAGPPAAPPPPPSTSDNVKAGAEQAQLMAAMEQLRMEQQAANNSARIAQELNARASATAASDARAEIIRAIHQQQTVPPTPIPVGPDPIPVPPDPIPIRPVPPIPAPTFPQTMAPLATPPERPPDNSEAIRVLAEAVQSNNGNLHRVAEMFHLSINQITQLLQAGSARPQAMSFTPVVVNAFQQNIQDARQVGIQMTQPMNQLGRDRSQSKPPEDLPPPPPKPSSAPIRPSTAPVKPSRTPLKPSSTPLPERSRTPETRGRSETRKPLPAPDPPKSVPVPSKPSIKKPRIVTPDPVPAAPRPPAPPARPDSEPPPERPDSRSRSRGRMPINYLRKMEQFERMEERAGIEARATKYMQRKKAAMHALEAEQKNRAKTADPPGGQVRKEVAKIETKIEASGTKPAREMSPRIRKKISIAPDAFLSRQRVGADGRMIQRYRGR